MAAGMCVFSGWVLGGHAGTVLGYTAAGVRLRHPNLAVIVNRTLWALGRHSVPLTHPSVARVRLWLTLLL